MLTCNQTEPDSERERERDNASVSSVACLSISAGFLGALRWSLHSLYTHVLLDVWLQSAFRVKQNE